MMKTFLVNMLAEGGLPFDNTTYIFFSILAIALLIGFSVLLFFRVKKDLSVSKHSVAEKGLLSFDKFKVVVDNLCRQHTKKLKYGLFRVDIRHVDDIKNAIGEDQIEAVYSEMTAIILKLSAWGIRVARFDDKTFFVAMSTNDEKTLESLSQLLINNLSKKYEIGPDMSISVAVNVAAANIPEAGKTMEEVKNSLDITMVMSKRRGENCFVLYNIKYINENTEEYKYYHEIREAIKNKEFILHYQPVIDINNLEVVSAEAMMRWAHKTKGILPPSEFLNIMEQTGDINWVGFWCFDKMLEQYFVWQSNYEQKFTISCNLSERQLLNSELVDELKKFVRKNKIEPSNIMLEIADLTMYNMSNIVKNNVDKLSQYGIKICFDGFGAKFTSLTALQDFPLDAIKLSKVFWSKIEESSIVKDTIKILVDHAKEKNIMLVAVGVEEEEEVDLLRKNGINYMQGFIFAKQKDPKDFISDVVFTPWTELFKDKVAPKNRKTIDAKAEKIKDTKEDVSNLKQKEQNLDEKSDKKQKTQDEQE